MPICHTGGDGAFNVKTGTLEDRTTKEELAMELQRTTWGSQSSSEHAELDRILENVLTSRYDDAVVFQELEFAAKMASCAVV